MDTASLAARFLFGKLFCVAITFGFGEKRCRKNLPLGDLRMKLELESGFVATSPTDDDFTRIEGEEFAILSGADADTYLQCAERTEPPWEYILEYQDGSLDKHYRATDGPIKLDQILVAFRKYRDGDTTWLTDFTWELMDLS